MSRRESVGRLSAGVQSSSGPPTMKMVSVAVLPPRLASAIAPATGIGRADAFGWDESLNWTHSQPLPFPSSQSPAAERKKSLWQKYAPTTQRERVKKSSELPPFVLRQVPYETWRKHYAKDKDGNYRGTHAPAEDCLLKPDDVRKWNSGEMTTVSDKWTRGSHALPVYSEVRAEGLVPVYEVDYDGPPRDDGDTWDEPIVTNDEDELASHLERQDTAREEREQQAALLERYEHEHSRSKQQQTEQQQTEQQQTEQQQMEQQHQQQAVNAPTPYVQTYDGKTAAQVIAEAKTKPKRKVGWKKMLVNGAEWVSLGS